MNQLPSLAFSENWNKKLDCNCFSTIRMHNADKYKVGIKLKITLRGHLKPNPAIVRYVKTFYLHQLTEGMSLLDTGYSLSETRKIMEKMYKNKVINLARQPFDFIILGYVRSENISNQLTIQ